MLNQGQAFFQHNVSNFNENPRSDFQPIVPQKQNSNNGQMQFNPRCFNQEEFDQRNESHNNSESSQFYFNQNQNKQFQPPQNPQTQVKRNASFQGSIPENKMSTGSFNNNNNNNKIDNNQINNQNYYFPPQQNQTSQVKSNTDVQSLNNPNEPLNFRETNNFFNYIPPRKTVSENFAMTSSDVAQKFNSRTMSIAEKKNRDDTKNLTDFLNSINEDLIDYVRTQKGSR